MLMNTVRRKMLRTGLRIARRMPWISRYKGDLGVLDLGLMLHSSGGNDEPKILRSFSSSFCLTSADVGQVRL